MADTNKGCCKWNPVGITSFAGVVTEIIPNSHPLAFPISQNDLQWDTHNSFPVG